MCDEAVRYFSHENIGCVLKTVFSDLPTFSIPDTDQLFYPVNLELASDSKHGHKSYKNIIKIAIKLFLTHHLQAINFTLC
jgi:hypothetical protein